MELNFQTLMEENINKISPENIRCLYENVEKTVRMV